MQAPPLSNAIYLAGPTASGKSAVALELAERLGGEIISVDSMQVYRGLDIGTAKPSAKERARAPHHLIDVAHLSETFDAARFVQLARAAEREICGRGRRPIFCGGTGLYFNALVGGLAQAPPLDSALRAAIEAAPLDELLAELRERDPATFERIDRQNPRRVIRAIELLRTTGQPIAAVQPDWKEQAKPPGHWFGLERERTELHRRIEGRVEAMFRDGLVAETAALLEAGLRQNRTAMQAIGYRQVAEHLEGLRDLAATVELVKQKTRQYAKRQMTWFRRQLDLRWIAAPPGSEFGAISQQILACVS